jgi:ABC-type glutathione transport system ATPase component
MIKPVEISNVQAIESIKFELPEGGGVVVFTGENGAGKTTAILALQGLLGAKVDLSPRDGTEAGEVTGLGRRMRVGKKKTITGATQVAHLGNRLDIGQLINPPVVDQKARNKYRLQALVSLGARSVKPEDLITPDLVEYIDVDSARELSDPIQLGSFLKRSLDKVSLEREKEADVKARLAEASRMQAGDLDVTVFQNAAGQGAGALDAATKLAADESVDQKVYIPFELVTPSNVADYAAKN